MENTTDLRDRVMLTMKGEDQVYTFEQLGITFDSTEREILDALQGIIRESNLSIEDNDNPGEYSFTVRKSTNNQVIHVYPKDGAGGVGESEKEKEVYLLIEIKESDMNALTRCYEINTPGYEIKYEVKEKTTK